MTDLTNITYVTYCGLYCRTCSNMTRIPEQARVLQKTLQREGFEFFGPLESEDFESFWKYLGKLADQETTCPGCRGRCGDPGCQIRICAKEKGYDICVDCSEYPCERFDGLARKYPNLLGDGRMLRELGLEKWIAEQEKRRERGFCFSDSRYEIGPD